MIIIKTTINHRDKRGIIIDLLQGVRIDAVTFISFKKGAVRGNHFHKKTTQWNYVLKGNIQLVTKMGSGRIKKITLGPGDLAVTVPKEKHALVGLTKSEMLVFTKGPRAGKEYESDTFRLENPLHSSNE